MDTPHDRRSTAGARAGDAGAPVRLYKPGQGKYVRWGSAIGAGAIAFSAAWFVRANLTLMGLENLWVQLVPIFAFAALGLVIFWIVGRNRTAVDFMIATEGEMKKVNWSSKREIIGATKVVIFSVFALSALLFLVDLILIFFFSSIDVLQVNLLGKLFSAQ
jgi:preprotein translocase SecE subunit